MKFLTIIVVLIFCFVFILPSDINALTKGGSMFWGIVFTVGAIGLGIAGIGYLSTADDYADIRDLYDEGTADYEYWDDLEGGQRRNGGLSIVGGLISGGIAVYFFNEALEAKKDTALININKDKFAVSVPRISYNILKNESSFNLLKYSF